MRLIYMPVNAAWAFFFGDSLTRMGDFPLLFTERSDAVYAARYQGLMVAPGGAVSIA